MEIVKKIIYFSVGIIMTVGFIAIGMSMYNRSKASIASANAQYDNMIAKYSDIEYSIYDGEGGTASGTEVRELINGLTDPAVSVYVKNGSYKKNASGDGVVYNCAEGKSCGYDDRNPVSFSDARKYMNDRSEGMYYINPDAVFAAEVCRNANGVISAVCFVQK